MPELPEVEHFRRLLLPLINDTKNGLSIETPSPTPPKSFPTKDEWAKIKGRTITNILRKGKLICIVLGPHASNAKQQINNTTNKQQHKTNDETFLFLHMGMTGRISTPHHVPKLESIHNTTYPPPHTHLILKANNTEASFSDPRRFGKVIIANTLDSEFGKLAPDALHNGPIPPHALSNQKKAIKALLLDQKAIVSGIGNWVTDEVLYQIQMHPDQNYLTLNEADRLSKVIQYVLSTAVGKMSQEEEEEEKEFPKDWLFHHRWSKGSSSSGNKVKDYKGRQITFVTSGGRTSAIVPSIQKKKSRVGEKKATNTGSSCTHDSSGKRKKTKKKKTMSRDVANKKRRTSLTNDNENQSSKTNNAAKSGASTNISCISAKSTRRSARIRNQNNR